MVFAVLINFDLLAFGPTGYGDEMFWGLTRTIQISLLAYALGICLGLCGAMGKLTGGKWLKNTLEGYTTLVRAVPDLVLILLLYYAGTDGINRMIMSIGLQPIEVNGLVAAVFVLGFVYGAFSTEVLRAGIQAVPIGQIEAAKAYGMSPWKVLSRVWFPRAVRQVLPTLAGETIAQLLATPLAFTIPVMELMGVTSKIRQDTFLIYEPLLFLAFVYFVLTFLITRAFNYFEGLVPSRR